VNINDLLLEFYHVGGFERDSAEEHGIEDYACAPNIRLEPFISLPFEDFRSYVGRRSTLLSLNRILVGDQLTNSEITDLNLPLRG